MREDVICPTWQLTQKMDKAEERGIHCQCNSQPSHSVEQMPSGKTKALALSWQKSTITKNDGMKGASQQQTFCI